MTLEEIKNKLVEWGVPAEYIEIKKETKKVFFKMPFSLNNQIVDETEYIANQDFSGYVYFVGIGKKTCLCNSKLDAAESWIKEINADLERKYGKLTPLYKKVLWFLSIKCTIYSLSSIDEFNNTISFYNDGYRYDLSVIDGVIRLAQKYKYDNGVKQGGMMQSIRTTSFDEFVEFLKQNNLIINL